MGFNKLGVDLTLIEQLAELNISDPTPIQEVVVPRILSHHSILATSQTGSGKTLAYLLPIIQQLTTNCRQGQIDALILVPTRELAQQVGSVCGELCRKIELTHTVIYGGIPYQLQKKALAKRPNIIIATPGRLIDLVTQKAVELMGLSYFVLDEVDQMVDLGFKDSILMLSKYRSENGITCCFSATVPEPIIEVITEISNNIEHIKIENQKLAVELIEQSAYYVEHDLMDPLLIHLLRGETPQHAIVFTRSRKMADRLTTALIENDMVAEAFHSERSQTAREHILNRFKQGQTAILVATDVMARGIDVDHITHVFNYGLPQNPELYIHRIGRTARAGRAGKAITLCEPREQALLGSVQKLMKQCIPLVMNHPFVTSEVTKVLSPNLNTKSKNKKRRK